MICNYITQTDNAYPEGLRSLYDPPLQIFVKGAALSSFNNTPIVAVVGSRKTSSYGQYVTERIVTELAQAGVIIVSGLAIGTDAIAHQTALRAGGKTIAVLPCGIDTVYPRSNVNLAKRIIEQSGSLISEYAGTASPRKYQFIARNRIIAALADAVLVPAAAERSGSLHTANFALELGKTVFAVPGNITSPLSGGTNNLIKTGAITTTEAADIFFHLGISGSTTKITDSAFSKDETVLINLLRSGVRDADDLLIQSRLDPAAFSQTLSLLEINGVVKSLGANQWYIR